MATSFVVNSGRYLNYENAVKLHKELEAAGIPAGIVSGGVRMYPSNEQLDIMVDICCKYDVIPLPGNTNMENRFEKAYNKKER
jgi:hypothetical protein